MAYIGSKPADKALTGADIEDGTVQIADLAATGTKDATTFLRGDGTFQTIGTNTPAFSVYKTSQNLTNDTFVKIQFDTEIFDTDNAFDNSTNYRFTVPSGGDGKYLFITTVQIRDTGNNSTIGRCRIYKNGTGISNAALANTDLRNAEFREVNINTHVIDTAIAGDYYEVFAYIYESSASGQQINTSNFSGYKLVE